MPVWSSTWSGTGTQRGRRDDSNSVHQAVNSSSSSWRSPGAAGSSAARRSRSRRPARRGRRRATTSRALIPAVVSRGEVPVRGPSSACRSRGAQEVGHQVVQAVGHPLQHASGRAVLGRRQEAPGLVEDGGHLPAALPHQPGQLAQGTGRVRVRGRVVGRTGRPQGYFDDRRDTAVPLGRAPGGRADVLGPGRQSVGAVRRRQDVDAGGRVLPVQGVVRAVLDRDAERGGDGAEGGREAGKAAGELDPGAARVDAVQRALENGPRLLDQVEQGAALGQLPPLDGCPLGLLRRDRAVGGAVVVVQGVAGTGRRVDSVTSATAG